MYLAFIKYNSYKYLKIYKFYEKKKNKYFYVINKGFKFRK